MGFVSGNIFGGLLMFVVFYIMFGMITNKLLDYSDSIWNWFFNMTDIWNHIKHIKWSEIREFSKRKKGE